MSIAPELEFVGQNTDGTPCYAYHLTGGDPVPALQARISELESANTDLQTRLDQAATRHTTEIANLQQDLSDAHGERIAYACELDALTGPPVHDQDDFDNEACTPDCPACTALGTLVVTS